MNTQNTKRAAEFQRYSAIAYSTARKIAQREHAISHTMQDYKQAAYFGEYWARKARGLMGLNDAAA